MEAEPVRLTMTLLKQRVGSFAARQRPDNMPSAEHFVERSARVTAVPGRQNEYEGNVDSEWENNPGVPLGSLPVALVLRALLAHFPKHPDPLTLSCQFLASVGVGPVRIAVNGRRVGRTFAFVSADLFSNGQHCLSVMATLADLRVSRALDIFNDRELATAFLDAGTPPRPDDCRDVTATVAKVAKWMRLFNVREISENSDPLTRNYWAATVDKASITPILVTLLLDRPLLYADRGVLRPGLVMRSYTTISLTIDFHSTYNSESPWLHMRTRRSHREGEMSMTESAAWTAEGKLLASMRQQGRMTVAEVKGKL
ncbi:thioesterase-like superfamily-domain-containing protein [Hyaloraphidium curvatum]|nr:thioesterase-like superfamily-domain-containing protein [Hyaloraphidium curvatum]